MTVWDEVGCGDEDGRFRRMPRHMVDKSGNTIDRIGQSKTRRTASLM